MHRAAFSAVLPLLFAAAAHGQSQPAETFRLDYRDVPLRQVISDAGTRLGVVIINSYDFADRVTLSSDAPVSREEALGLVNQALWERGYRLTGPISDLPGRLIVRIVRRATEGVPGVIRAWRPDYAAQPVDAIPAALPGVDPAARITFRARDVTPAELLAALHDAFGIEAPAEAGDGRLTLIAPQPLAAGEALTLVNELLLLRGQTLHVDVAGGRTALRIAARQNPPAEKKAVMITFDDAPLESILDPLARYSGCAITNNTPGLRASLHARLELDSTGMADIGPAIAELNAQLRQANTVIEFTSRKGNPPMPALVVWNTGAAARTLLPPPPGPPGEGLPAKQWPGIAPEKTMRLRSADTSISDILPLFSDQLGFVVMSDFAIAYRLNIAVPEPLTPVNAVKTLNDVLTPMGYQALAIPSVSGKATLLRVVTLDDAQAYYRSGTLPGHARAATPAGEIPANTLAPGLTLDPPLPPNSADDLERRMQQRRAQQLQK